MTERRKLPSKSAILTYWDYEGNFPEALNDGQLCINRCWACGSHHMIQRCHILPKHSGGTDDASNLHLLCASCHHESEDLTGNEYWNWYKYKLVYQFDFGYKRLHSIAVAYGYMDPQGKTTKKGNEYLAKIKGISIDEVEAIL